MSSPITNLRKTSLASQKIINNPLELRTKEPRPIEEEVYYVRRNSPYLMEKESLILNMTNRLTNLENEMMGVRQELIKAIKIINRKDAEISMLKQQLFQQANQPIHSSMPVPDNRVPRMYEEFSDDFNGNSDGCYYGRPNERWMEKYNDLSDRVAEMEKFLADYGMIWVGDKKSTYVQDGIVQTAVDFVPNFDKVIPIIGALNERSSSESHIKIVGNEARFQKLDILNITFYKDGMKLENNNFRKYSAESVQAFFRDLEDGYYPTELKESYPEGVIFKVTDKRSLPCEMPIKEAIYSGPGYRLGTRTSLIKESNPTKVYFQFDIDAKKTAPFKTILKKKHFEKLNNIENYSDPNESRHNCLHIVPFKGCINTRGDEGYVLNESSCKQMLKKFTGSKDKLNQNKREKKNVVFEKPPTDFKNTVCF